MRKPWKQRTSDAAAYAEQLWDPGMRWCGAVSMPADKCTCKQVEHMQLMTQGSCKA